MAQTKRRTDGTRNAVFFVGRPRSEIAVSVAFIITVNNLIKFIV